MSNKVTVTNAENSGDVVLVVKRKKFPWWIFLLLLPLVLLIPVKRDINVEFLEGGTGIAVAETPAAVVYPEISTFGGVVEKTFSGNTDTEGKVVVKDAKMPLWYKLFGGLRDSVSVSCENDCNGIAGLKDSYKSFPENSFKQVHLSAKTSVETVKVIDVDDNEPLPEATVTISGDGLEKSTVITDVSGAVDINSMPVCGTVRIVASRDGYESDTLEATLFDLNNMSEHEKVLKLRPLKGCVKVIVKNLKTKTLLAGATVTLTIDGQSQKLTTNTNGVGIGQFDSLRITQQLNFLASKSGYADTTLSGYSVKDFMALDEEKRTMYLRPLTTSLVFINTDNNNVLEGVTNKIYKNGSLIATEYSNSKGEFIVSNIGENDKISIVASKTGYSTNSTKVKNQTLANLNTQASRTIPLTKNEPPKPTPQPTPPQRNDNPPDLKGQSGDLRVNLQWYTKTDLDLHVIDPCGNEIYFSKRRASCGGGVGTLDLDANALFGTTSRPQENIYWNSPSKGTYTIKVHCFKWRERVPTPITYNITVIDKGVRTDKRGQISSGGNIVVLKHTVN
ncbi:MAG: carboxypeptidase regulatory-like domain-containing protein [Bacteroidales bacterium]|nr:carboxypeptidase regulatory-like domain-containing protein [Bacteroidales bacterium]